MPDCGYEFYLLAFNSISRSLAALTSEISSWTREDKIYIYKQACTCNILYSKMCFKLPRREVINSILPGQGTFQLQTWRCCAFPLHFFPPYFGAGELHWRVLDCSPCLQLFVHVLHRLHPPQFPSTESNKIIGSLYLYRYYIGSLYLYNKR